MPLQKERNKLLLIAIMLKHGKHDQKTHGRRGKRGGGKSSISQFNSEMQQIDSELSRRLEARHFESRTYSQEEQREIEQAIIDTGFQQNRLYGLKPNSLKLIMQEMGILHMSPQEFRELMSDPTIRSQFNETDIGMQKLRMAILQQAQHRRAVALQKLTNDEQQQIVDSLINDTKSGITLPTHGTPEHGIYVDKAEQLLAFSIYGNPNVRYQIAKAVMDGTINLDVSRYAIEGGIINLQGNKKPLDTNVPMFTGKSKVSENIQYLSFETRLVEAEKNAQWSRTGEVYPAFIEVFTGTHSSQNTSNVLGAAIQHAVLQVGPNAQYSLSARSYYPPGITPPQPHPQIVSHLNRLYDETQENYRNQGITDVELYRGTRNAPINGISMSPWTERRDIANDFSGKGSPPRSYINTARVPIKYVLINYLNPRFNSPFSESEFLILETAALANGVSVSSSPRQIGTDMTQTEVTWTFKSRASESALGIIGTSGYVYEPQYDIFYNYRSVPEKTKKKSIRFKHGKHDQKTHGRRGKRGGGKLSSGSIQQTIDEYRKRNAEIISRTGSMSQEEFNTALQTVSEQLVQMDEQTQMALVTDPDVDSYTALGLMLFGKPAVRDEIAQRVFDAIKVNSQRYEDAKQQGQNPLEVKYLYDTPFAVNSQAFYTSLEFRILADRDTISKTQGRTISDAEAIWSLHASGLTGVTTAHIQQIMTVIGPNAGVDRGNIRSFFPGTLNPEPNPRFVRAMQDEYDKTQAEMSRRGITEMQLYRSSPFTPGLALEPWTPIKDVAKTFSQRYRGMGSVMRSAKIPVRYFLSTFETASGWRDDMVIGKSEYMIAGLAYANDQGLLK